MLMVDRVCRVELLRCDPNLETILKFCRTWSNSNTPSSRQSRVVGAKLLVSLVQRDHEVRKQILETGGLDVILEVLKETDGSMVQFCMATVLAAFVLDDAFMEAAQEKKECYKLFQCSLALLGTIIRKLEDEEMQPNEEAEESVERDGQLSVRLCEGCAQAVWGSSYFCAMYDSEAVSIDEITELARLAKTSAQTNKVCLAIIRYPK